MKRSAKSERNYRLSNEEIEALREEYRKTKKIPNPHNRGAYHFFVEALKQLGINKVHPFKAVKESMRKLMSAPETKDDDGKTAWQRFSGKEARNDETGKDVDGRIAQNAVTLQRTKDYGLKLMQVGKQVLGGKGMVVDILKGANGLPSYRLDPNSDQPLNEFKRKG